MARPRLVLASTLENLAGLDGMQAVAARSGAGGQIAAVLRRAIVNIDLVPGTALNETDVAVKFGVSRTLLAEGLLNVMPQKGTFVSLLERETLRDALFVREALECSAARLAASAPLLQRKSLLRIVDRQRGGPQPP